MDIRLVTHEELVALIGALTDLNTTTKTDIVAAINEVLGKAEDAVHLVGQSTIDSLIGIPSASFTPHKGDMYNIMSDYTYDGDIVVRQGDDIIATGEFNSSASTPFDYGDTTKNIYLHGYEFDVSSGPIDLSGYVTAAQLSALIGALADLDTTDQSDIVAAINELVSVKQNKATITSDTTSTVATLEMANNTEKRFGELTSLTLSLPNTISDNYISSVVFTSGNIPTNLIYPDTIKISGEDCIDGVFIPIPDKIYELNFKNVGSCVWCVVGGVE